MATTQLGRVIGTFRRATLRHEEAGRTDGQLLDDYVRGRQEAAFAALVQRHGSMVWGVCRRVLRSPQDAEDAFQATFLVLVRKAPSVLPRDLVANWLYGVAHQTALKARATAARRGAREKQVPAMPEPAVQPSDPWQSLEPLLDRELSRLPDKYRAVIVLCDLEGKTRKEAARHFRVPEGTVASRLATARAMLAKRLARYGPATTGAALVALLSHEASAAVPGSLASETIKAAIVFGEPGALATGGFVRAAALAEGVLHTMLLTKLKNVVAAVAVVIALAGTAVLAPLALADKPADPPAPAAEKKTPADKPAEQPVTAKKAEEPLPNMIVGVVQAVDAERNMLSVAHREGGEGTYALSADVNIEIDGKFGRLAALPKGANVILSRFVNPTTARNVQANGRSYYGNLLKAVDPAKNTITIKDRDEDRTFAVAHDAMINVDGKAVKLAAVPAGAFVNLGLAVDQQTVKSLGADGPCLGDCGGSPIKAVDTALGTITFDDKANPAIAGKTYTLAKEALVYVDGKPSTLAAVPIGSYVNLNLRVDGQTVGQLRAQGPSDVCDCHGSMVSAVDTAANSITFDEKAGPRVAGKTFTLAKDGIVVIDGKPGSLAGLPPGSFVTMRLWTDGQTIGQLNAQGPPNVCDCGGSQVTAVDVEKRTITFDDRCRADVAGKTFSVARDANIIIDGRSGTLAALPVGCLVQMTLCVDKQTAGTLFAQGPEAAGNVVKAVHAGKGEVTIDDATYPVAKNANITIDGQQGTLATMPAGAKIAHLRLCVDRKTVGTLFVATK